jgi:hypothetical protein
VTTRRPRSKLDPVVPAIPAARAWPPTCERCGWQGEPDERQPPYLACGGDPARHQRTPVGAAP